jgi:hypothetical protein
MVRNDSLMLVQPEFDRVNTEKCDLDEVDPKKLAQLRELAKETIKENRNAINRIPKPGV